MPIYFYKITISPFMQHRCRFYPTCSQYCIDVIKKNGLILGITKGVKRIIKCHPWNLGGHDPVD
ncbi:membrane protein insertion efficiency factor YidD [Candidatus Xenohaliotis californiensis]